MVGPAVGPGSAWPTAGAPTAIDATAAVLNTNAPARRRIPREAVVVVVIVCPLSSVVLFGVRGCCRRCMKRAATPRSRLSRDRTRHLVNVPSTDRGKPRPGGAARHPVHVRGLLRGHS